MPLCYIYTTLKDSDIPDDFEARFQNCIAEVLNKPLESITIMLNTGLRISQRGKKQPALVCQLHSIGSFNEENNKKFFPKMFQALESASGLSKNNITIEYVDLQAHMVMEGIALA